jgi:YfiH family protein
MILHNEPSFLIYFGDKGDRCVKTTKNYSFTAFKNIQQAIPNMEKLVFLKQEHGVEGISLKDFSSIPTEITLFKHKGDFIVTNLRQVGIGILTADCLPLIFYDPVKHVVSVVHVGWQGSVHGIVQVVVNKMKHDFGTSPTDLIAYLGPCAKVCCYVVEDDFLENLEDSEFTEQVIFKRDNKTFFNLPRFIKLQLLDLGVKQENIRKQYNSCTICDERFHSYRRDKKTKYRQATVVVLK